MRTLVDLSVPVSDTFSAKGRGCGGKHPLRAGRFDRANLPARRRDSQRYRVGPREALGVENDPGDGSTILLYVLGNFSSWRGVLDYAGRALCPHYVAPMGVGVEV